MLNSISSFSRPCALASLLLGLALTGCGGSDGGAAPAAGGGGTTPSTVVLDSFNRVVASTETGGDGSSGVGVGDAGADGTAADGAPIAGGTVTITDATGKSVTVTTDAQGYYRAKVTGFVAPFVAKVTKDGKSRHSLNVKAIRINGFITLNLSGLTDKVASDVAQAGGQNGAGRLTPAIVSANSAAITSSIESLKQLLAPVISSANINAATFDPLSVPFVADRTGYDFVLDNTVISVDASGRTQVAVSPTFQGGGGSGSTLTGNWNYVVDTTVEGQTFSHPVGSFPGSQVPTAAMVAAMSISTGAQQVAGNYEGYTVTVNGNTVTVTGLNTNLTTVINSFSAGNYQGCGACGVGSTVSYTMSYSTTTSGTIDGVSSPAQTVSFTSTSRYTRIN